MQSVSGLITLSLEVLQIPWSLYKWPWACHFWELRHCHWLITWSRLSLECERFTPRFWLLRHHWTFSSPLCLLHWWHCFSDTTRTAAPPSACLDSHTVKFRSLANMLLHCFLKWRFCRYMAPSSVITLLDNVPMGLLTLGLTASLVRFQGVIELTMSPLLSCKIFGSLVVITCLAFLVG